MQRKIFALILSITIIFSMISSQLVFLANATVGNNIYTYSDNLLENPGFENGTVSPWGSCYVTGSGTTYTIATDQKRTGNYSMLVNSKSVDYNSPGYPISKIIKQNGNGKYKVSAYIEASGSTPFTAFNLRTYLKGTNLDMRAADDTTPIVASGSYYTAASPSISIDNTAFTLITFEFNIHNAQAVTEANIVFCPGTYATDRIFYVDDMSLCYYGDNSAPADDSLTNSISGTTVDDSNYLSNGGFESGTTGWSTINGGSSSIVSTAGVARSGTHAMLAAPATAYTTPYCTIASIVKAKGDGVYQFGMYVKPASPSAPLPVGLELNLYSNYSGLTINGVLNPTTSRGQSNLFSQRYEGPNITDSSGYTKLTCTVNITGTSNFTTTGSDLYLSVYLPGNTSTYSFYIDSYKSECSEKI